MIANVNRDPKKRGKPYEPQDFMPGQKGRKNKLPTLEEMRLMNIAAGGQDIPQEVDTSKLSQVELKKIAKNIERTGRPNG